MGPDVGRQGEPALDQRKPLGEVLSDALEQKIVRRSFLRMALAPQEQQVAVEDQDRVVIDGQGGSHAGGPTPSRPRTEQANMVSTLLDRQRVNRWHVLEGGIREPRIGVLRRALGAVADVLVPPLCLSCHRRLATHDALCPSCWKEIGFIRAPLCDRLGLPLPYDTGRR